MYTFAESMGTGMLGVRLSPESGQLSEDLVFTFSTLDGTAAGEYIITYYEILFLILNARHLCKWLCHFAWLTLVHMDQNIACMHGAGLVLVVKAKLNTIDQVLMVRFLMIVNC